MRISDRYIGKQVLWGTLYAVLVLGVVLVLGNLFQQIRPLLVDWKAPLPLVLRFVINVLPLSLMYTIPWGFLSAVLLVFGKLSSNQEITSFRVAGVSLVRLSLPVFVIGIALSGVSLYLNINVVPNSKATVRRLIYEQASRDIGSMLKPGVVQADMSDKKQKLLIEGKNGDWLEGFNFYMLPGPKSSPNELTYIHATRAAPTLDRKNGRMFLKLQDAYFESRNEKGETTAVFAGEAEPVVIDLKSVREKGLKANSMTNGEILKEIATNPTLTEKKKVLMRAEITTRYSFSMACIAFAFIGIPLGLQTRRRDNSSGLIISLLIGTGYFMCTMMADQFKTDSAATLVLWAPNVVCVVLGLFLFRRARFR